MCGSEQMSVKKRQRLTDYDCSIPKYLMLLWITRGKPFMYEKSHQIRRHPIDIFIERLTTISVKEYKGLV